jgi:hypothetical protein
MSEKMTESSYYRGNRKKNKLQGSKSKLAHITGDKHLFTQYKIRLKNDKL